MKRHITIILCLLVAALAIASVRLTPSTRLLINKSRQRQSALSVSAHNPRIGALVKLSNRGDMSALHRVGCNIQADLGDMAVVSVAADRLEALAALPGVEGIDVGLPKELHLDFSHLESNTPPCYSTEVDGRVVKFDGSGVVCGLFDLGLDAHHINFLDTDGRTRFSRIWYFADEEGNEVRQYDSSNMSDFVTDDSTETHATHVAGIIGGYCHQPGYSGIANTNQYGETFAASGMVEGLLPYQGVATGAELAGAFGELSDANIVSGVSNIIDYARSQGKPCVVNLSLGTTGGPHDGTDYFTAALSRLGTEAIICVSAGNDGNRNMSIVKTLSEGEELKTMTANRRLSSYLDIWSDSDEPLQVSWWILDRATGDTWAVTEPLELDGEQLVDAADCEALSGYSGQLYVCAYVDPANNRFNFFSQGIDLKPLSTNTTQWLYVKVEGRAGSKVYMYGGSNVNLTSGALEGFTDGTSRYSISNNACAENILSVGAYISRNSWPYYDGTFKHSSTYATTTMVGTIGDFSSYGPSVQGHQHPLICAPGTNLISSLSKYYINNLGGFDRYNKPSAYVDTDSGDRYVWAVMSGTSMSCPYVAGAVALWLQADPTLDFDKVMEVIDHTAVAQPSSPERWGAGRLDTYAGLQYVLANRSFIGSVWQDDSQRLIVTHAPSGLDIFVTDASRGFTATLYDLQGRPVATTRTLDSQVTLSTTSVARGIYLLRVATPTGLHLTQKLTD